MTRTTSLHAEVPLQAVRVPGPQGILHGDLALPEHARAIVVFAHGSGSSRHSPRNRFVARVLQEAGLATLLMDLLSEREEHGERMGGTLRFDVPLLAERLSAATDWLGHAPSMSALHVGYFGASTGAAAALIAAAARPQRIAAVVSRGGRPDLVAADVLGRVQAPCLFIVGGDDHEVLQLNKWAVARLHCEHRLEVVPGASHLFEEPGTLEQVAELARDFFVQRLAPAGARASG